MKFRRRHPISQVTDQSNRNREAFTLVELLVVIGIIALLISILLPALSAARKQAATVKCEASLREIGNAFMMYVQDNNGWAPPARLYSKTGTTTYSLYDNTFDASSSATTAFWFNFLSKYLTKTAVGNAANTSNASQQLNSVFWGCPAWTSYMNATVGGINVTQPGYGMNGYPEYTPSWPPRNVDLGEPTLSLPIYANDVNTPYSSSAGWATPSAGKWYKFVTYQHLGSERALCGDCLFWFMEALSPLNPPKMAAQYTLSNAQTWSSDSDHTSETTFDFYRHGTYPKVINGDEFDPYGGGKVRFNVLFCDGHVRTLTDRGEAYKVVRMRYPG